MGTRSLTSFIETYKDSTTGKKVKQKLVTIYRQMDGYPSGMGKDLADFLKKGKLVNGIGMDEGLVFNGMGCLAAQAIKELKDGAGGVYIYPVNSRNCGEEYIYEIEGDFNTCKVTMRCFEVGKRRKLLFEGNPKEFDKFLAKEKE